MRFSSVDPELLARLERIARAGICLLPAPEITSHFIFERDGCAVLVQRRGSGFGAVGNPGQLTSRGFAALVEKNGRAFFVYKDNENPAQPGEAEAARRLFQEIRSILR